jgi:hypothetical protein
MPSILKIILGIYTFFVIIIVIFLSIQTVIQPKPSTNNSSLDTSIVPTQTTSALTEPPYALVMSGTYSDTTKKLVTEPYFFVPQKVLNNATSDKPTATTNLFTLVLLKDGKNYYENKFMYFDQNHVIGAFLDIPEMPDEIVVNYNNVQVYNAKALSWTPDLKFLITKDETVDGFINVSWTPSNTSTKLHYLGYLSNYAYELDKSKRSLSSLTESQANTKDRSMFFKDNSLRLYTLNGSSGQYDIDIYASDGYYTYKVLSKTYTFEASKPVAIITIPKDGATYSTRTSIHVEADEFDEVNIKQMKDVIYTWSSDIDGELSKSSYYWNVIQNLSVGKHILTLTVRDALGQEATDHVSITITE